MTMRRLVALCFVAMMAFAPPAGAQFVDTPLADPALERRAHEIHKDIRCLVCQNQAISDSNATLAQQLRTIVRERIAAGDSDSEVRAYLVARYGDWVLMRPPLKASTVALWVAPFVILLAVVAGAGAFVWRRRRGSATTQPLDADEEARLAAILDRSK
jgi:cytochrome c-type biogenesis protein CcmH